MGLNLSRGKPVKYYTSDRIVQLIGNGLLTFIDKSFIDTRKLIDYSIPSYDHMISEMIKSIIKNKSFYSHYNIGNISD